ncbi:MAG: acyltransferase [Gammaproteobacteria bacterium]|nr:acyltransferase [Gammaproteobacteria bacterium]
MKYRAEIDGLRALAVIPVILFHAGFEVFSGGFVGVDIFFVISGYLITTIILSEKNQGTFSLANFYDRRARRIIPALFLVMFVSFIFAWFWLLPSDMKDFSQSLVAVSFFSSNILFWQETGYWGVDNELKPLLHTWSLAVEEQYYFIFPLFLMLMWRFQKRWILGSFIAVAIISLMMSQWGAYNFPTATFFLLPTRGWELAIGAAIAFYFLYRKQSIQVILSNKFVDEALGLLGLILILFSIFSFDETVPFPSLFALIPTIGAGLIIIFSSPKTIVGRLLGTKILVGIGVVSYSAYLWHQPIFSLARHRSLMEPDQLLFSGLVALTFIFAYFSWKYVERPFRTKKLVSSKSVFIFWLSGSVLFIGIGMAGYLTDGFNSWKFKNNLTQDAIEKKWKVNYGLNETCGKGFQLSADCRTGSDPEILVWGDSFAMHLVQGIMASNPNAKIIQITKSVCGPFFDIAPISKKHPESWGEDCLKFTGEVRKWLRSNNTVKYVVVSSPFSQYLSENSQLLFRDGSIKEANIKTATIEFEKTLKELVSIGVKPVIFSPPPANDTNLGRCLSKAEWMGLNLGKCDFNLAHLSQDRKNAYKLMDNVAKNYDIIRLDDLICDNSLCKTHLNTVWVFRDSGHLSHEGSALLGKQNDFYSLIVGDR